MWCDKSGEMNLDIRHWLPHRSPMLMLSKLVTYDEQSIHCTSEIAEDNPLLVSGHFPCLGGVELFAQAAGVLFGIRNFSADETAVSEMVTAKESNVSKGAVVQIKHFELGNVTVPAGSVVDIRAYYLGGSEQAVLMQGEVRLRDETMFRGKLMIALFEEDL